MNRAWLVLLLLCVSTQMYANIWQKTGQAYGIEPRLFYAISKVESNLQPLVVSVNFRKMNYSQRQKLAAFIRSKNIPYKTHTKVIEINSRNISQAKELVNFLDRNRFVSFDIGLMQINNIHKTELRAKGIPLTALFNEETNLKVAADILWKCYEKHGSTHKAINAYNGRVIGNPYYSKVSAELKKLLLPHENSSKRLFYRIL